MKKILIFLVTISQSLCFLFQASSQPAKAIASEQSTYGYYKALSSCLLFRTSDILNMSIENIFFIVPEGYFVKKISDTNTTTLKVTYGGKYGFVSKERIKSVSFLPKTKYLDGITFSISSMSGTQLWKIPSTENQSNILIRFIPAGTSGITYVAEASGEIPTGSSSNKWYYCLYSPGNDTTSVYEGYIHSEKTSSLSAIPPNLEDDPSNQNENNKTDTSSFLFLRPVLISFLSITIISLIIVLFLSSKRKAKEDEYLSNQKEYHEEKSKPKRNDISKYKNHSYTLKDKFESFFYKEETKPKKHIVFESLDSDDDEYL